MWSVKVIDFTVRVEYKQILWTRNFLQYFILQKIQWLFFFVTWIFSLFLYQHASGINSWTHSSYFPWTSLCGNQWPDFFSILLSGYKCERGAPVAYGTRKIFKHHRPDRNRTWRWKRKWKSRRRHVLNKLNPELQEMIYLRRIKRGDLWCRRKCCGVIFFIRATAVRP